jgi:hypothetical protein
MRPTRTMTVIAAAGSLAFLAAGCGSSGSASTTTSSSATTGTSSTTSASSTETWASGVCTSITTWQSAIKSAVSSLKSDPSKQGLQTAAGDAKSATTALASDLKGLGKPDTSAGQQAKDSLDQLATTLKQNVDTIESAAKGASGVSGVLSAVATVTSTAATMATQVKATFKDLNGLDAKGELKGAFASSSACDSLTSGGS